MNMSHQLQVISDMLGIKPFFFKDTEGGTVAVFLNEGHPFPIKLNGWQCTTLTNNDLFASPEELVGLFEGGHYNFLKNIIYTSEKMDDYYRLGTAYLDDKKYSIGTDGSLCEYTDSFRQSYPQEVRCICGSNHFRVLYTDSYETSALCINCNLQYAVHTG